MYIHIDDYEPIETKGLIGKTLYRSANDYGVGGILY